MWNLEYVILLAKNNPMKNHNIATSKLYMQKSTHGV